MTTPGTNEQDRVRGLVEAGAEVTGQALAGAAGAVAGYSLSGPSGAAAGAAIGGASGPITVRMLEDMAHSALDFTYRMLGRREKVRVGAVVVYCYEKFQENLNEGRQPRQDGFFDDAPNGRSADKEVFEAVMLAAQREPEEKKLRFMGNLVANIAFEPQYDRAHANYLVRVAEDMSYRQLCLLSLFGRKGQLDTAFSQASNQGETTARIELIGLMAEIHNLCERQMLTDPSGNTLVFHVSTITPLELVPANVGASLYRLMELDTIDRQELAPLTRLLQ